MVMSCLDLDLPESSTNARFWRPAPAGQHENSSKWSYTTDQIMRMNIQIMCQAFFDLRRLGRLSRYALRRWSPVVLTPGRGHARGGDARARAQGHVEGLELGLCISAMDRGGHGTRTYMGQARF